ALLAGMKELKEVTAIKEVRSLTAAMFPGTHCPLMGAAMAVRGIRDAVILLVGTDECAYYAKHMTLHSEDFGGLSGRCLSVVLDAHDVTFGCRPKLEAAFAELAEEYKPKAVFLVTTCVIEVIGDDVDSLADALAESYGIPVLPVHTEHFKCENHLPGLTRTLTACFELMERVPCDGRVNLLGQRMGRFETTELSQVLRDAGVSIGLQLPCGCDIRDIREAGAAKVNIVVNDIALPLAEKMKNAFDIPYVFFDKFTAPSNILRAYEDLFRHLDLPLPAQVRTLHQTAMEAVRKGAPMLSGVTYIYGNTPFQVFEFNRFMAELGMVPQLIQTAAIEAEDRENIDAILRASDPYVTKTANIAPLQYVYGVLKPQLYLGHEYALRLRQKGIALVRTDGAGGMLGFEVTPYVLKALTQAVEEARSLRREEVAL
nr:nitrogenase component 1 [Clostridia bacterium]